MYESRKHPPLPRIHFFRRLALHVAGAMGVLLGSLLIGMSGTVTSKAWHGVMHS